MKVSSVFLSIASFIVVIAGLRAAKVIIVPFLLSLFLAFITAPPFFWLQRKGLPKWLSLLTIILVILFVALLMSMLVGTSIQDFSKNLPEYEKSLGQQSAGVVRLIENLGFNTSQFELTKLLNPSAALSMTGRILNGLAGVLTRSFLILLTVIFMLLEASAFILKFHKIMDAPEDLPKPFSRFINNVKRYTVIKTLTSLGTGFLVTVWLSIIGVDYAILWGVMAFAMNFVPNIGSILAAIPAILLCVIQLGLVNAFICTIGYVVINVTMSNIIEPRFMGKGLDLSILVVFLSLLFWGWVLGPVGMLLSVPLTITVKIALEGKEETSWIAVLLSAKG